MQLNTCTCDYPEPDCSVAVRIGNDELHCCIKLPSNQTEEVGFKISRVRFWRVRLLQPTLGSQEQECDQKLELSFEYYNDGDSWRWVTIYTNQAFLLSTCMHQIESELLAKDTKGDMEMQIEVPELEKKKKKQILQYAEPDQHGTVIRKIKFFIQRNKDAGPSENADEDDL
nr:PREDICTED: sorting nexin-31 [Latimeria chalumnae]|eukprot:XP_014343553.1 PREDICTED: sorting nexin-31 [Latimeria chalumnae]